MSTLSLYYAIRLHNRLGVDIRQNFAYHMITPHKKWNPRRQYRMKSQQYCSLDIIHDSSAGNCLKWTEVGDEA